MLEYEIVKFIFCTLDCSLSSSFHVECVVFYVFQFKLETRKLLGGGIPEAKCMNLPAHCGRTVIFRHFTAQLTVLPFQHLYICNTLWKTTEPLKPC